MKELWETKANFLDDDQFIHSCEEKIKIAHSLEWMVVMMMTSDDNEQEMQIVNN